MRISICTIGILPLLLAAQPALAITWTQQPGQATTTQGSLASNRSDTWVVGTGTPINADGNQVYQYVLGAGFQGRNGGAVQISVPSDGALSRPWENTASGLVKQWDANSNSFFVPPLGANFCAKSLAVGPASSSAPIVWAVGCGPDLSGYGDRAMYRYTSTTGWQQVNPGGVNGAGTQ